MDLRCSDKIVREKIPSSEIYSIISPFCQDTIDYMFDLEETLPVPLMPGQRALLSTIEEVEIPSGCYGHICLRSTFARLGLLVPPTIADPGFKGTLTLEIYNASYYPILISPRTRMWSIHYFAIFDTSIQYKGRYQGQKGITLPKALKGEG